VNNIHGIFINKIIVFMIFALIYCKVPIKMQTCCFIFYCVCPRLILGIPKMVVIVYKLKAEENCLAVLS
jgi:hypothetical protein